MVDKGKFKTLLQGEQSHFWRFGAFQILLIAGLVAYLLHASSETAEKATPASEMAAENLAARPPMLPEITGSVSSNDTNGSPDFATYENRDMFGGDYGTISNASQSECEFRCSSDPRCRAYTFNKWENACFLKSSIGVVRIEPQGITGIVASEGVKQDQRPPSIQKSRSKRLAGDPYRILPAISYEGCSAACLADHDCLGFNLATTERTCSLLSSVGKPTAAIATDAGIKVQRSATAYRPPRARFEPISRTLPSEIAPIFETILRELPHDVGHF